jgi:hypothetical protein
VRVSRLPDLLVALAHGAMALGPEQLLGRLEDKAARLGDPNPWLVQARGGGRGHAGSMSGGGHAGQAGHAGCLGAGRG